MHKSLQCSVVRAARTSDEKTHASDEISERSADRSSHTEHSGQPSAATTEKSRRRCSGLRLSGCKATFSDAGSGTVAR